MPSWVAAGAAVVGVVQGARSSSKATKGAKDSAEAIQAAAGQAREDVLTLFPQAIQSQLIGAQGAFDIFGQALPTQQRQVSAGNLAAQRTQQTGFQSAQAALLGLPQPGFQTSAVPFDPKPAFAGTNLSGTPEAFNFSGGLGAILPTFQGLGNQPTLHESFLSTRAPPRVNAIPNIPFQGSGGEILQNGLRPPRESIF